MIAALIYLIVVSLALGWSLWKLLGIGESDTYSAFFQIMATGIGFFVISSTIIGFAKLSSWITYLLLGAIMVGIAFWRRGAPHFRMPNLDYAWIVVLLLFLIHLYVYTTGAFSYEWLEDDDPWVHSAAVTYVSIFNTYIQPDHLPLHYLAPYPPFFDVLLGTLYQVDGASVQSILKFFNALLVSLSIPLFYGWVKQRLDNSAALWATAILVALPSFMSHFIWAQTLAMLMAFPSLYFLDHYLKREGQEKRNYGILAVLVLTSVLMAQPSTAGIIFIMVTLYALVMQAQDLLEKRTIKELAKALALPFAALLLAAVLFWGPMLLIYGWQKVFLQMGLSLNFITDVSGQAEDTSGGIVYGLGDLISAPTVSKMDQPTGLGFFVFLAAAIGLGVAATRILAKENRWFYTAILLWLVFCLLGLEGNALPYKMMPHRFWVYLAIPVAILAATGVVWCIKKAEEKQKDLKGMVITVFIIGLLWTSAYPKYVVETSAWPPGQELTSDQQVIGYVGLKQLPSHTKVFSFCGKQIFTIGMDKSNYPWDKDVTDYTLKSINDSVDGNYAFLKKYGFEYAIIDQGCFRTNKDEEINSKIKNLGDDTRFTIQKQLSNNGFLFFKIE